MILSTLSSSNTARISIKLFLNQSFDWPDMVTFKTNSIKRAANSPAQGRAFIEQNSIQKLLIVKLIQFRIARNRIMKTSKPLLFLLNVKLVIGFSRIMISWPQNGTWEIGSVRRIWIVLGLKTKT